MLLVLRSQCAKHNGNTTEDKTLTLEMIIESWAAGGENWKARVIIWMIAMQFNFNLIKWCMKCEQRINKKFFSYINLIDFSLLVKNVIKFLVIKFWKLISWFLEDKRLILASWMNEQKMVWIQLNPTKAAHKHDRGAKVNKCRWADGARATNVIAVWLAQPFLILSKLQLLKDVNITVSSFFILKHIFLSLDR